LGRKNKWQIPLYSIRHQEPFSAIHVSPTQSVGLIPFLNDKIK